MTAENHDVIAADQAAEDSAALRAPMAPRTPAAQWREKGEPDPHGDRYACERATLALGHLSDDELANGAYLNYDRPLNVEAVLARTPNYHAPVVWMTAAKDRIRWLSRRLLDEQRQSGAMEADLQAANVETERLRVEVENLKGLYHATNALMAVLGMHGEIYARDDRSLAVMDALHAIDKGVPLVDPNQVNAARYLYLRERDLDSIKAGGVFAGLTPNNVVLNGVDLDETIDRARAGEPLKPRSEEEERPSFEQWAISQGMLLARSGAGYRPPPVHMAWIAWKGRAGFWLWSSQEATR